MSANEDGKTEAKEKKSIPLRLSASLHKEIAAWAEDDFRSLNSQIEFLLTECVRRRRNAGAMKNDEDAATSRN